MALTFNTPGVYVQEIPTLPSSIVASPTAVPVFIGYTEKAIVNGVQWTYPTGSATDPIRITSMLDFQALFGGPHKETFDVTLTGPNVNIAPALTTSPSGTDFRLFYNMQMYFANGGGPCYIVSVGDTDTATITGSVLQTAIAKAEKVDEITLVVIPEAMSEAIGDADRKSIYDAMLAHCAKMKDRFSVFDVEVRGTSIADDGDKFRNLNVSSNNLSYGAAYYPSIIPTLSFNYVDTGVNIIATDPNLPANVQVFDSGTLDLINNGVKAQTTVNFTTYTSSPGDILKISFNGTEIGSVSLDPFVITTVKSDIQANPSLNALLTVGPVSPTTSLTLDAKNVGILTVEALDSLNAPIPSVVITSVIDGVSPDKALYNRIKTALEAYPITLYPSAMMAGIYAAVDNDRGVWKAPANVSITLVSSLGVTVKESDQGGLNVDPIGGKSIDVLRQITGRGMLVWGARTLAGNDNEWRYINVRRLFLMIEDACKHATEFVVFEPNDKNTWIRVKGMIDNFLTGLWRDGALTGNKPEQAFFVKVGLGQTMTAQDILEGKMIVQIGLAAVRPAEFIILQFEHKLQEA
jgi:hypothetical protein